jgi:hypothetical protein
MNLSFVYLTPADQMSRLALSFHHRLNRQETINKQDKLNEVGAQSRESAISTAQSLR